jgi:hypothetical protein
MHAVPDTQEMLERPLELEPAGGVASTVHTGGAGSRSFGLAD